MKLHLRLFVRDLLWLTALCAVLVAWWMDRNRYKDSVQEVRNCRMDYKLLEAEFTTLRLKVDPPREAGIVPAPLPPLKTAK